MSDTKHRAGPWEWHSRKDDDGSMDGSVFHTERPGMAICVCKSPKYATEVQWIADARLIAAAPAMLEALEIAKIGMCAVGVSNAGERQVLEDALEIVRAAIALATGKEQS